MQPKRTAIATVREHLEDWRRENRWSRETLADQLVQAHERLGFDDVTDIRFDPPTRDTFERLRVNADRIYRWLDDTTKDRNLLPANFICSMLAALPMDRRLALVDALLGSVDLAAREVIDEVSFGFDPAAEGADQTVVVMRHFRDVVTTAADAQVSMAQLTDGVHAGEPEAATASLSRMAAAGQRAMALMRWLRRGGKRKVA